MGGGTALITVNPVLGAVVGASLAHTLETIGKDVIERNLSARQQLRVGRAIAIAYGKLKAFEQSGRLLRDDGFFSTSSGGRSCGDEVTEATLLAAMSSAEERKVDFIASLLANVATDASISSQTAHLLINQAERLSFRSFVLLNIASKIDQFEFGNRHEQAAPGSGLPDDLQGLELEIYELIHSGLLVLSESSSPRSVIAVLGPDDVNPGLMRLTGLGRLLHANLCLQEMEQGDDYQQVVSDLGRLSRSERVPHAVDGGSFPLVGEEVT